MGVDAASEELFIGEIEWREHPPGSIVYISVSVDSKYLQKERMACKSLPWFKIRVTWRVYHSPQDHIPAPVSAIFCCQVQQPFKLPRN